MADQFRNRLARIKHAVPLKLFASDSSTEDFGGTDSHNQCMSGFRNTGQKKAFCRTESHIFKLVTLDLGSNVRLSVILASE